MGPTFSLAWQEFALPFRRVFGYAPGGRDFLWLTLMLVPILTLALLLSASRTGILNKMVDVMLGSVPGYGVPVWVIPNPVAKSGIDLITNDVLSAVEASSYAIFPYREVVGNIDFIELLDPEAWSTASEFDPEFAGWAVNAQDPLWLVDVQSEQVVPLEIILNKQLFERHFNAEIYMNSLETALPRAIFEEERQELANGIMERLWVRLRVGDRYDTMPLRVVWRESFPSSQPIAFLFPLSTYHALQAAQAFPEFRYFPEFGGQAGKRAKKVQIEGDVDPGVVEDLASQLNGTYVSRRGRHTIEFQVPYAVQFIESWAREVDASIRVLETEESHELAIRGSRLALPCATLPVEVIRTATIENEGSPNCMALSEVTARGQGYLRAFIYVADRTDLSRSVAQIRALHEQALSIHPVYQDALNRFGFLARIIDSLRFPYGLTLFLFLVVILAVQIGTLVEHRKSRYAILLSKGMHWRQIYFLLYAQMVFTVIVSVAISIAIFSAMRSAFAEIMQGVSEDFPTIWGVKGIDLLEIGYVDYLVVVLVVFLLQLLFVSLALMHVPINGKTQIGQLLKA